MKNKLLVLALLLITISTQAQVGKWLLNNNANDATSNAINGTLTGSPTFSTTAKEGAYALVTNGTSQYIDLGNPSLFPSGTSARTISAWAMTNNVSGSRSIFAYGTNATSKAMVIGQNGTSLIGGAFASNVTVTSFWATGVWHHICLTYDGTTAKLYADGSLVSSSAMSWSLTLAKAYIGRGVNSSDYWSGSIDDVRIYNTALTATQVQTIATAPPAVPTGLTATSTAPTSVSLSWTDASTNETGFSVERSTTTGTGFTVLTTTAANSTSYTDATATEGTNYFYRIQSTNVGGSSIYTSEATVTTLPNAPTGLTATTASATSITLNWTDASSKETGYDIERSLTSGSGFSVVGTAAANAVTYTDASLTTGTTYYYRLKSKVGTVGSVYSSVVSAVASIIAPTVSSSNLQFSNVNLTSLTLTWTPGNGQRRIVILREYGSSISRSPTNGQSNTANSDKSLAQNLGEHNFLVYDGIGSSVTITGLINSTAYAVGVFEYNGTDATSMYLSNSPLTGSTTTAGAIRPTVQASNLVFSNVSQTSMTLSWTPGNGERRVIIASNGSSGVITKWPSNGQVVSANSAWSLGQNLDGNNHAVYDGTGSSVTITGLTPSTSYAFGIFEYNGGDGSSVYMGMDETSSYLTSALTGSQTTTTSYDFRSGAELLTNLNNWSSADAAYTTIGATGGNFDESDPEGFFHNVWFKFQATSSEIDIRALHGGSKGTIALTKIYLFDAVGNKLTTVTDNNDSYIQTLSLTPGAYYYFTVEDENSGSGTFTVQINDQIGYDMASKALLLTDLNSWSSADAAYSNAGATGSSFNGDPWGGHNNVWFKFQATTNEIDIRVLHGGSKGTLLPESYLFDANGNKLVVEATSSQNSVSLQSINLTPGSYYYFSVDDPNTGTGTFTIQINDKVDFDMAAKAYLLSSIDAWTSADAVFNNVNATGCYFNGNPWAGYNNVWFKFRATTNEIDINLLTGGIKGTLTDPIINLFDVNGTQLAAVSTGTSSIKNITLTPGSYYYFSVDDANTGGGTFSLFIDNGENYDFKSHALLLTDLNNWSSADAAYSNVGATPDAVVGSQASCIPPNHNVWFKFQATTNEIEIKALTGGTNGEIGYITLSLFEASGNSVACHYSNGGLVSFLQVTTLTPGSWYYFSIDNAAGGQGTFSLKVTDTIGYDLKANAENLTNIHNWSSAGNAYSNVDATPDAVVGSQANCIPPNHNVWFKFQATTNEIEIKALTGGTNGNIGYISLSLFDASGNSVACDYSNGGLLSVLLATTLTPGSWYYFSVDNAAGGQGAFALKVNDAISYDRRVGAELLTNLNNWSSADAAYTNVETTGTGFNEEPGVANNNVWFKFQATTNEIDIRLLTGGNKGTLGYPNLHLFDENGNLLDNARYTDIQRIDLTPGSVYYFSVDSEVGNSAGTFSIRINDHVDYNMRAKAELLTNLNNWSSADAAYTNVGATSRTFNEEVGSAANNVWFKFQATTTEIDIRLLTGGTKGTFTNYPRLYLYDEAGNPLDAQQYTDIQRIDLLPGSNYYIMVFSATDGAGTFSLQVNDHVNYNMRAKAELLTNLNNWSSDDAAYTNVGATARAFNEEVGGVNNVWFKFQATTNEIDIRLLTGGSKGTFTEYPRIVLYDEMGTRLNFEQYTDIQRIDLTPGSDYYIMVYSETNGTGTFSLQINDHVNYNMRAKAELLTNISDWRSEDAGYSNDGATNKGFNEESGGGYQNVWFKFLATTNKIDIKVLTGEEKGTLSNPIITLFDNDGNVIASEAKSGHTVADLTTSSLIIGSNYYFSIDNVGGATYIGTFSLELGGGLAPNALCDNIYCTDNGGVGIGTAVVPTGYALAVNGKVIMEGAKVEVQSKWPDYVFEKDYPIAEIPALKKYIEEHGHLPNVPSAKTVEKEGIDVEEINIALLQKIEELSLYMIKMEERLKKLEQENNTLRKGKAGK